MASVPARAHMNDGAARAPLHAGADLARDCRKGLPMTAQSAARAVASEPDLLRESVGDIAVLTLNRPEIRNTLSESMLASLGDAFTSIAADRGVRVVVLAANGPAFSGGHDLKEMSARRSDPDGGRAYVRQVMLT